jgi:hypothetical protein
MITITVEATGGAMHGSIHDEAKARQETEENEIARRILDTQRQRIKLYPSSTEYSERGRLHLWSPSSVATLVLACCKGSCVGE